MLQATGRILLLGLLLNGCGESSSPAEDDPLPEPGTKYIAVTAASSGGCGVTLAGGLHCWGRSYLTDAIDTVPRVIEVESPLRTIEGTHGLHCGSGENSYTYCYGSMLDIDVRRTYPDRQVSNGFGLRDVQMGYNHGCGIAADSTLSCWGGLLFGVRGKAWVGPVPGVTALVAEPLTDTSRFLAVVTAVRHTCGILASRQVVCWGDSTFVGGAAGVYLHGDNPCYVAASCITTPTVVPGLVDVSQLSSRSAHTCALSNGVVYCWGRNDDGQLGQPGDLGPAPIEVTLPEPARAVAAGTTHSCALGEAKIYCWGMVDEGAARAPFVVGGRYPRMTTITAAAGVTCALGEDQGIYCWGQNGLALGDGTMTSRARPALIADPRS